MRFPLFERPLTEVGPEDLDDIVDRKVREGLFVEYKGQWSTEKVARAVASFANSDHGGTLIIGIEADKLDPTKVAGVTFNGSLAESAVNVIRSTIAPTPSTFRPWEIQLADNTKALIVEVPPGNDPPYIHTTSGRIFVRTPTSSEPVDVRDRETVDRLFGRGRRGQEWALDQAAPLLTAPPGLDHVLRLILVPCVDGGLGADPLVFRESFLDVCGPIFSSARWLPHVGTGLRLELHQEDVRFTLAHDSRRYLFSVNRSGLVLHQYTAPDGANTSLLHHVCREILPTLHQVIQKLLGYEGRVCVGVFARLAPSGSGLRSAHASRIVPVTDVSTEESLDVLRRELNRAFGEPDFEPEQGSSES